VEVTFDIDANGILSVSAQDKGTGKEQRIVIQPSSGLSKEEIGQMVDDAKSHEAEDQRRRAEIETRNQADSLAYGAQKMIEDNPDKISEDLKAELEAKIASLKAAIEANNVAEMQTEMTELSNLMQRVGQEVYGQAGAPGPGAPPDGPEGNDEEDGTVEGQFREV
jgi:molecular chaperone DnaK